MKKCKLGIFDLEISEVGFGCMFFGIEKNKVLFIFDEVIEFGINYLDIVDLYDCGCNEEIVGDVI